MALSQTATIDGLSRMDNIDARPTLRFLTCGSVDDGKSTLIGRLLHDQGLIFDDQLSALERNSLKHGTVGADIDFALLLDGLEAEREQGITIDVAYRYFSTKRRAFIVADTPGMSNIRATWRPARPTPTLLFCWLMRAKGCSARRAGTR